jgi:hypothetical protein
VLDGYPRRRRPGVARLPGLHNHQHLYITFLIQRFKKISRRLKVGTCQFEKNVFISFVSFSKFLYVIIVIFAAAVGFFKNGRVRGNATYSILINQFLEPTKTDKFAINEIKPDALFQVVNLFTL